MKTDVVPRKIFSVLLRGEHRNVYDIEGKEHEGFNDTATTWWIYDAPHNAEMGPPKIDCHSWRPYSVGIMRFCWELKIKQTNTSKEKWGETQYRNSTSVEMICNGKPVYKFTTTGSALDYALAKIQYLQVQMAEHPFNFFDPESEIGRKICWYGLPATILLGYEPGEIRIKPDYSAGLSKEEWWAELKRRQSKHSNSDDLDKQMDEIEDEDLVESENNDIINWGDALSDGNIYWFRK